MPEATSTEIYEDVDDFWAWIHTPELADLLKKHSTPTELDLGRIMAIGGSAGGTLSLYLAFAHPTEIRSVTAAYPVADFMTPAYTEPRGEPVWGQNVPESVYHDTMDSSKIGAPVSSVHSPERSAFMLACFQHGHLGALYARGAENTPREKLSLIARLEQSGGAIPCGGVVIIQGRQDSVIPMAETENFVKRARELTSPDDIVYVTLEGEHGCALDSRLDDQWLQDALWKAIEAWLK
jgi:acetyl esterase/lipase